MTAFSNIKKRFQRRLLQSDAKNLSTYITTYQSLTAYFPTFYGKKLAFCFEFLYLCTGNRKNSLLVPKVGHLWRPRLVLIDGKRRSSMKTTKMGRKRLSQQLSKSCDNYIYPNFSFIPPFSNKNANSLVAWWIFSTDITKVVIKVCILQAFLILI